jgi:hypothetical protein
MSTNSLWWGGAGRDLVLARVMPTSLFARHAGSTAGAAGVGPLLAPAPPQLSIPGGGNGLGNTMHSERTGVIGTGYYISPEIANGWATYDHKARGPCQWGPQCFVEGSKLLCRLYPL